LRYKDTKNILKLYKVSNNIILFPLVEVYTPLFKKYIRGDTPLNVYCHIIKGMSPILYFFYIPSFDYIPLTVEFYFVLHFALHFAL